MEKVNYLKQPSILLELIGFTIGDEIGSGSFRDVYDYALDEKWVIKIENRNGTGDNWIEWRIWNEVKDTPHSKWFAPCYWISANGLILMQKKATPIYQSKKKPPLEIPIYFDDVKKDNFGWIGNQLVCFDYSFSLEKFMNKGGLTNKMQKLKL